MSRSIALPIIIILAAIGFFFMYGVPAYEEVQSRKAEERRLDLTLENAEKIVERVKELEVQYNSFPREVRERLETMLPTEDEQIDIIVEVNNLALSKGGVILTDAEDIKPQKNQGGVPVTKAYNTSKTSYSFVASYPSFLDFLSDLENSLRLTGVEKMSIETSEASDLIEASLELNNYWLSN